MALHIVHSEELTRLVLSEPLHEQGSDRSRTETIRVPIMWRLMERLLDVVRVALCGLRGHDTVLHYEPERLALRCLNCGQQSVGWSLPLNPPPKSPGFAAFPSRAAVSGPRQRRRERDRAAGCSFAQRPIQSER
jgi:hypothetical protein